MTVFSLRDNYLSIHVNYSDFLPGVLRVRCTLVSEEEYVIAV